MWYADGLENPVASPYHCHAFVRSLELRNGRYFRVIGSEINAPLIAALYRRCEEYNGDCYLELASPHVCETPDERRDPVIALYRMRQCLLAPSLGGWHRMTSLDYPSYALAAWLSQRTAYTAEVAALLRTHPAYHDLTFLPTLQEEAAAAVLGSLLDPRWYIDHRHPHRLSRVKLHMGLSPACMQRAAAASITTPRLQRCAFSRLAWRCEMSPTEEEQRLPGNFLWRRWEAAGGGIKGCVRATQAFIGYLLRTWQQQLVANSPQRLELFIPAEMFRGDEVAAYTQHAKLRPVVSPTLRSAGS